MNISMPHSKSHSALLSRLPTLPLLSSLKFVDCSVPSNNFPLPYLPHLQELCVVGFKANDFRWSIGQDEVQLRHITLSPTDPLIRSILPEWAMYPSLESLTLYVDLSPYLLMQHNPHHDPVFFLLRFLEMNSSIMRSGTFRLLRLHATGFEGNSNQRFKMSAQRIETRCNELGIPLEIIKTGERYCLLPIN